MTRAEAVGFRAGLEKAAATAQSLLAGGQAAKAMVRGQQGLAGRFKAMTRHKPRPPPTPQPAKLPSAAQVSGQSPSVRTTIGIGPNSKT